MTISPTEIAALTAAHNIEERHRAQNAATEFILTTPAGYVVSNEEGIRRWLDRAQGHLSSLLRDTDIAKASAALVARFRTEIPLAEAALGKASAAKPAPSPTLAPIPPPAPDKPVLAPVVIKPVDVKPAPVVTAPASTIPPCPLTQPSANALLGNVRRVVSESVSGDKPVHVGMRAVLSRQAQNALRAFDVELTAIHAALKRYRAQVGTGEHSRHQVELRKRIAALEARVVETVRGKAMAREEFLKSQQS